MGGILPFFFSLTRALGGRRKHRLLNGLNYRVRILARREDQCQFIPKPLARSGKIEIVTLDGETVGESNASPGRMTRVGPVASFQQHRVKHSELDYFPGYSVNLHPVPQADPISSH